MAYDSKGELYAHLVWATYRRYPLLVPDVERAVYRCIQQEARLLGGVVLALGGIEDHVHLVLKYPRTRDIAQMMKQIKGVSSKFAGDEFVRGSGLLDFFRWQEGYASYSVCADHTTGYITYVKNQKEHHANGTLRDDWEHTE